jgi:hypothetical protein
MTVCRLTNQALVSLRQFIETTVRPLEMARFRHAFEGGSADLVLDALKRYQNPDGGFGRALEPDVRADESSALCTSIAFRVLRSIGAKTDQAVVSMGIRYLLATLDRREEHWRIIPASAEKSPHAPWWNQTGRESEFDDFSLNPSAEILGYLVDYQELIPRDLLALLSDRVLGYLSGLEEIEMHDLLCCVRLLQTATLPGEVHEPLLRKLTGLVAGTVARDPEQWSGYSLRPLQVVDSPASPFMSELQEAVAANLDYEIASQNQDGWWTPTWTWGDAYPDHWKKAQREWAGILTLENLLLLERFGRIEGAA